MRRTKKKKKRKKKKRKKKKKGRKKKEEQIYKVQLPDLYILISTYLSWNICLRSMIYF